MVVVGKFKIMDGLSTIALYMQLWIEKLNEEVLKSSGKHDLRCCRIKFQMQTVL